MAKNLDPKCKQCRREGEKLMLKGDRCDSAKCAMVKKNYPPGAHGGNRRPRQSDYSIQLREKQKAKKIYNILEKQFRITFEKAKKQKGDAGENLLKMLETRLDNTVFRLGFSKSRSHARQLVSHGHFTVGGKKINIPSYQVKAGDVIKIKKINKKIKAFENLKEKFKKYEAPGWLNASAEDLSGKVLHQPSKKDFDMKINTQMIVEFYSR
ncbi:30S ribosomal protein S4 [Patescibacteria group bacterium]|nr:30S ribosomal protein S4 [Patescibacteria group bacterium]MBU4600770.1 30S ribosomal protein S4 [Patescibacteria group bacterium]MCG2698532.1 30S ribosomal protein S4 [Candidatus Parcubacteria bacterium]